MQVELEKQVVGIGDLKVSNSPDDVLITYALGSCLGIALYDYREQIGGLLHAMLPQAKQQVRGGHERPARYVDTGFKLLVEKLYALGGRKNSMVLFVAGGARRNAITAATDVFNIGERNLMMLKGITHKNNFRIYREDTGGIKPRTMELYIRNGAVIVNKGRM